MVTPEQLKDLQRTVMVDLPNTTLPWERSPEEGVRISELLNLYFPRPPWYKRWWRRVVSLVSLSFLRKNYGR